MIGETTATRAGANAREEISLDGAWRFRLDGHGDWRTATVPGPWQAEFADLRHSTGKAIYARQLSIPAPDGPRDLRAALDALDAAGIAVDEASLSQPTLDDAFFALAGERETVAA